MAAARARMEVDAGRRRRDGPLLGLLLGLTAVTGVVGAVSYLDLGHVFVANMTGNALFVGFALAGASGLSVSGSLIALAAFLAGALAGGRLIGHPGRRRADPLVVASTIEVALVAASLWLLARSGVRPAEAARDLIVVLLAFAMGVQSAAARRLGVPGLTTTVLTMTLTDLAADWRLTGETRFVAPRLLMAVAALLAGAAVGGFLVLRAGAVAALALAAGLLLCIGLTARWLSARSAPWAEPT